MDKIKIILNDLDKYSDYNFEKDVTERLNKTLERYLDELDKSYSRLRCKNSKLIIKEVSK